MINFLLLILMGIFVATVLSKIERKKRRHKVKNRIVNDMFEVYDKIYKNELTYDAFECAIIILSKRLHVDANKIKHSEDLLQYETRLPIQITSDIENIVLDFLDAWSEEKGSITIKDILLEIAKKKCIKNTKGSKII